MRVVFFWQLSKKRQKMLEDAAKRAADGPTAGDGGGQGDAEDGDEDDAEDDDDEGDGEEGGDAWINRLHSVSSAAAECRSRILRRLDHFRYACAEGGLDELASCSLVLLPYVERWPDDDKRYKALVALVSFLATADEAWTTRTAMDDDGSRTDVGYRHLIIEELRSSSPIDSHASDAVKSIVTALPAEPQRWKDWRNRKVSEGLLQQRRGRMDTRDNVSEDDGGFPNEMWLRKLDHVQSEGANLQTATTYADVNSVVASIEKRQGRSDLYHGFSNVRGVWITQQLVLYLPRVRDETGSEKLKTPAMEGLDKLFGKDRAARYHDHLQVNCQVLVNGPLRGLPMRMRSTLLVCSDAQRDYFAKEASICEDERELKDMARQYYKLAERKEKGSTLACTPAGLRKPLPWWTGTARVMRRAPGGGKKLMAEPEMLTFLKEDAPIANKAMLRLVDELLLPLFVSAPPRLVEFLKGGKKAGKKRARDEGGLSGAVATHYERMLAVVHLINVLDVWRRESTEFLI